MAVAAPIQRTGPAERQLHAIRPHLLEPQSVYAVAALRHDEGTNDLSLSDGLNHMAEEDVMDIV